MDFLADFLKLGVPLLAAVGVWYLNERAKRGWEEYIRKEGNYKTLLSTLRGFYVGSVDTQLKDTFLEQLNECWLYCPDNVVRKCYDFVDAVKVGAQLSDKAKEIAFGELVVAIRKDLLKRRLVKKTNLTSKDFRHLRAT